MTTRFGEEQEPRMELSSAAPPRLQQTIAPIRIEVTTYQTTTYLQPAFFYVYSTTPTQTIIMQKYASTVDRLDRPSAYYQSKVRFLLPLLQLLALLIDLFQNKRRKYNSDRDDADRVEEPAASLKDATTLYVGNLYADLFYPSFQLIATI